MLKAARQKMVWGTLVLVCSLGSVVTAQDNGQDDYGQAGYGSGAGSFSWMLGMNQLDEDLWAPLDEQFLLGFTSFTQMNEQPFGFEYGLFVSAAAENTIAGPIEQDF
ncbi:MAG: hypothetical protein IIB62_12600, partial [Proteobacteria bacterium]|nr:hypothetical protein [Pseudomonadota bacterium]